MLDTRADVEKAGEEFVSELHLECGTSRTKPEKHVTAPGYDGTRPYAEEGLFGSLMNLSLSDADRHAYAEDMRRGNVLLNVHLDEHFVDCASDILERASAINLNEQEATWRRPGWTGHDAAAHGTMRLTASTGITGATAVGGGQEKTFRVVEERLVVGKWAVGGGRMRVRT